MKYKNGSLEGERKMWYKNGKLWIEEYYINGKLEGERKVYSRIGNFYIQENYKKGRLISQRIKKYRVRRLSYGQARWETDKKDVENDSEVISLLLPGNSI